MLTVHEAAALLRISRNLAYELVARGELPAIRPGRVIRVPRAALEYDRGTMHATDYRAKLAGYHRYYDSRQFEDDFGEPPVLLVVAQDDRAEEHVARAARLAGRVFGSRLPLILTAEWRFARDPSNARGLPGPIWRTVDGPEPRRPWPDRTRSVERRGGSGTPTEGGER